MLDEQLERRINLALDFQEPDQVPVCDFLDNPKIFYYFSHTNHPSLVDKVKAYHELGIDICWQFERRKDYRSCGLLEKLQRFALRKPKLEVLTPGELAAEFDDFKSQQAVFAPQTYLAMSADGCLSVAYKAMGYEEFCKKMYVELIEVEKLIEIFAENLYQRANEFADKNLGPIFFIKDDIAYDKGLIFSHNFLEQHWLPRIKNTISPLKKKGIKVILHSSGDLTTILDALIDAGISGIHPVDASSGMDIGLIKKQYASSLLLFGNVILTKDDTNEDIQGRTKDCIKKASYGGGHFIGSNNGVGRDLKLQNILSFFTAVKEFGKYPSGK